MSKGNDLKINPTVHNNFSCLAQFYNLERHAFQRIIRPIWGEIKTGEPERRNLHPGEVRRIVEFMGEPTPEYCYGIDPKVYRTVRRLAVKYKVSVSNFDQWIKLVPNLNREFHRRFFTPREIKMIIEHLGTP